MIVYDKFSLMIFNALFIFNHIPYILLNKTTKNKHLQSSWETIKFSHMYFTSSINWVW